MQWPSAARACSAAARDHAVADCPNRISHAASGSVLSSEIPHVKGGLCRLPPVGLADRTGTTHRASLRAAVIAVTVQIGLAGGHVIGPRAQRIHRAGGPAGLCRAAVAG